MFKSDQCQAVAYRRPSKIVPNSTRLWRLLKIAEFRAPTPQDVREKGSKILKLPSVPLFPPIFGFSWPLSSWTRLPLGLSVASLRPPHWCRVCPSALVHSSHMASPFPPDNKRLPRCPSCWFCALLYHSSRWLSPLPAVLYIPSSADKFGASCFPSRWATTFGHGFHRLQVLVFVGQYKPKALELIPNRERGIWLVLINVYLKILCWGLQPEDWIYDWQRWDVKRRMWWNVDCILFCNPFTAITFC